MPEAYGDEIHRRLAEVKATYDPDNVFHHDGNIPLEFIRARDTSERAGTAGTRRR
ncbi:MAG TPA: BBE domain-containing protein [Actinomycetota bacterium]|nr:BBE domain-containing protein [Actinomycetota bacterium]